MLGLLGRMQAKGGVQVPCVSIETGMAHVLINVSYYIAWLGLGVFTAGSVVVNPSYANCIQQVQ